ncbi:MAG: hypothetical protein GY719_41660 [bacterium]|nr:hypothetical protein [bacterium]
MLTTVLESGIETSEDVRKGKGQTIELTSDISFVGGGPRFTIYRGGVPVAVQTHLSFFIDPEKKGPEPIDELIVNLTITEPGISFYRDSAGLPKVEHYFSNGPALLTGIVSNDRKKCRLTFRRPAEETLNPLDSTITVFSLFTDDNRFTLRSLPIGIGFWNKERIRDLTKKIPGLSSRKATEETPEDRLDAAARATVKVKSEVSIREGKVSAREGGGRRSRVEFDNIFRYEKPKVPIQIDLDPSFSVLNGEFLRLVFRPAPGFKFQVEEPVRWFDVLTGQAWKPPAEVSWSLQVSKLIVDWRVQEGSSLPWGIKAFDFPIEKVPVGGRRGATGDEDSTTLWVDPVIHHRPPLP